MKYANTTKLRVWWYSDGNTVYFYIDNIDEYKTIVDVLSHYEMDNEDIIMNSCGLEEFNNETCEWETWYSEEGYDIDEYLESLEE